MLLFLDGTAIAHGQTCKYQQRICECDRSATKCHFTLIVEDQLALVSYKLVELDSGQLVRQLNSQYTLYFIDNLGRLRPIAREGGPCIIEGERFLENNCTTPMIIDSVGNENFIAINGLIPGPTLVVTYNQTVVIEVINRLINKEISIHWHGQFQNNTPWMDGVDHITQCPIPTYASFRYIFKANPSGTMWYHSHVGTQRTEGLFGALIVQESENEVEKAQNELQNMIGDIFTIVDIPEHIMSFLDWQREDGVEITLQTIGRNPLPDRCDINNPMSNELLPPIARIGIDGTIVSRIPFQAGLINGLGIQRNVSFSNSRLSVFDVSYYDASSPKFYRFRLVGAQRFEMFNFSISEHKLIVIAADGYLTEPLEVDYIFIHAGERYDFLLKPKTREEANGRSNYLITAETLDRIESNRALAFLHYGSMDDNPVSTEYKSIIESTIPRNCSDSSICKALNCPFVSIPNTFINCIPVTDLKLLFPTPDDDIPTNNQTTLMKNEYFFDFSFTGSAESAAVSGRNFAFPPGSLLTQSSNPSQSHLNCKSGYLDCSANRSQCICLHLINIDKSKQWDTVQFVWTNIGGNINAAHPIHLHGHSFQVVGIYYGEYNASGTLIGKNTNITCSSRTGGSDPLCTNPGWTNTPVDGSVTRKTIRKDTVVVPRGGYVVIRFISNNWGFWYMHCHIEPHFLEGMAAVVNEAYDLQNQPPSDLSHLQCGDFTWTVAEFNEKLSNPRERQEGPVTRPCAGS